MAIASNIDNEAFSVLYPGVAASDMRLVETILAKELRSEVHTVTNVSEHILNAGGKRLRPSLVILSARSCSNEIDCNRLAAVAASTEMLHMATLMHDDVIDSSTFRRGHETVNSLWGNQISVLTGDYILAKVFSMLASDGELRLMRCLSDATILMTEGEVAQLESAGHTDISVNKYLAIIHNKTAAFMAACCRLGAIVGDGGEKAEESLQRYGTNLGIAFQITDDLLDLTGDPRVTGKPIGGDIREGKVTLPLILTLEKVQTDDRLFIKHTVQSGTASFSDIERIHLLAEQAGGVDETRRYVISYLNKAVKCLDNISSSAYKDYLVELTNRVLNREK